jgi:hypothetical protein
MAELAIADRRIAQIDDLLSPPIDGVAEAG